jgi:hypothetical protein
VCDADHFAGRGFLMNTLHNHAPTSQVWEANLKHLVRIPVHFGLKQVLPLS